MTFEQFQQLMLQNQSQDPMATEDPSFGQPPMTEMSPQDQWNMPQAPPDAGFTPAPPVPGMQPPPPDAGFTPQQPQPWQPPPAFPEFQAQQYVPPGYDTATQDYLKDMARQRKYAMLAVLGANMMANPGNMGVGWGKGVEAATDIYMKSQGEERDYKTLRSKGKFDRKSRGTYDSYLKRQAEVASRREDREAAGQYEGTDDKTSDYRYRAQELSKWAKGVGMPEAQYNAFMAAVHSGNDAAVESIQEEWGVPAGAEDPMTSYQQAQIDLAYERHIIEYAKYLEETGRPSGTGEEMAEALGTRERQDESYYIDKARKLLPKEKFAAGDRGRTGTAQGGDESRADPQATDAGHERANNQKIAALVTEHGMENVIRWTMEAHEDSGNPIEPEVAKAIVERAISDAAVGSSPGPIDKSGEPVEAPEAPQEPARGESRSAFLTRRADAMKKKLGEPDMSVYDRAPGHLRDHPLTALPSVISDTISGLKVSRGEQGQLDYIKKGLGLRKPETYDDKRAYDQAMGYADGYPQHVQQKLRSHLEASMSDFSEWPAIARAFIANQE